MNRPPATKLTPGRTFVEPRLPQQRFEVASIFISNAICRVQTTPIFCNS